MDTLNYGEKYSEKIVLALGYFDSIHKGHQQLLKTANKLSTKYNALSTVLIFTGGYKGKNVFTLEERLLRLKTMGIKKVIIKELTQDFMKKSYQEFIQELLNSYNIVGIVTGSDFTYGYKGLGDTKYLEDICRENYIEYIAVDIEKDCGEKISSSKIKNLLTNGDIKKANELLCGNYFIYGKVERGKGVGKTLGFPTANVKISEEKYPLKEGVYLTFVYVENTLHSAITNVGSQPTFQGKEYIIETYIDNFDKDIYDKYLTVYFIERIRDVIEFDSIDGLKKQLLLDKEWLK